MNTRYDSSNYGFIDSSPPRLPSETNQSSYRQADKPNPPSFPPDFVRRNFLRRIATFRFERDAEIAYFTDLYGKSQGKILWNGLEQVIDTGSGFKLLDTG